MSWFLPYLQQNEQHFGKTLRPGAACDPAVSAVLTAERAPCVKSSFLAVGDWTGVEGGRGSCV